MNHEHLLRAVTENLGQGAEQVVACLLYTSTREYWDDWSKDIATIAGRHITMIRHLLDEAAPESELRTVFAQFVEGLQQTLNPAIDEDQAIEMLAQHLITQPVFDAMFAGHRFTELNPCLLYTSRCV